MHLYAVADIPSFYLCVYYVRLSKFCELLKWLIVSQKSDMEETTLDYESHLNKVGCENRL